MADKQEKKYVSDNAQLMAEWDWEKNNELGFDPQALTCGSSKKVWWICSLCQHSWMAQLGSRNRGTGCPVCGRIKATAKYRATKLANNSLQENRPDLLEEWDYELNGEITPKLVTASSGQKVWWKCSKCNQSWLASVALRSVGEGCPICSGQKLVAGVNDLATVNPRLASEWDYDNNTLAPSEVSARNNIKAAWICSVCGHRWTSLISVRNRGSGCPQCQKSFQTSLPERIIYFYVKQAFPDAVNGFVVKYKKKIRTIDILIPTLKLAIEYDGSRWHEDSIDDIEKTQLLQKAGLRLIRVRELDCPEINDGSFHIKAEYSKRSYEYLTSVIIEIFEHINREFGLSTSVSVNIDKDYYHILKAFEADKRGKSLAVVNPVLAQEWDYQKNEGVSPNQVSASADKRFWWMCSKCGFSWKATVYDRNNGHGCPACVGLTVRTGYNDLQTMRPELVDEWDYEKNISCNPSDVSYRGNKKIWWKCKKCGYSWQSRVADRSKGIGCPACAGKVSIKGITDLATVNPQLALEWDYEKNGDLKPQSVRGGSNKKVWWKCKVCQYSWQARIDSRHIKGRGCPACAIRKRRKKRS